MPGSSLRRPPRQSEAPCGQGAPVSDLVALFRTVFRLAVLWRFSAGSECGPQGTSHKVQRHSRWWFEWCAVGRSQGRGAQGTGRLLQQGSSLCGQQGTVTRAAVRVSGFLLACESLT